MSDREEQNAAAFDSQAEYFEIVRDAALEGDMLSAKRRLAQLYHTGRGTARDDSEAVRWYSLAALQAMNAFYAAPTLAAADAAFNILLELGELHRELGDIAHAVGSFERIDAMLSDLPEELAGAQSCRWEQIACNRLGSLHERSGEIPTAYSYFSRALALAQQGYDTDPSVLTRDDLAVASYRVGLADFMQTGKTGLLLRAQELWDALYEETGNYDYRSKRCVIDTLFATASPTGIPTEADISTADAQAQEAQLAPSGESLPDTLAAELGEYIRQHGYSKSGAFDNFRLIFEIISILAAIGVCLWAYFSGAVFELFKWLR